MLKTILTAAFLATTLTAAAHAENVTRQVRVSYSDLDLRHPADVKRFDQRLRAAVTEVCPEADNPDKFAVLRCRKAAFTALADRRAAALATAQSGTQLALNSEAH